MTDKPIRFGRLRERVKRGELDPVKVLEWARTQRGISPNFLKWLENFDPARHKEKIESK